MGNKLRYIILIFILLFSSCSWITDFVITNKSKSEIKISYNFKTRSHSDTGERVCLATEEWALPVYTENKIGRFTDNEWEKYDANNISVNKEECKITIKLPAENSARIFGIGNYTGHKGYTDRVKIWFNISELTIYSDGKEITYEGYELLKQFKKVKDTLYVLKFK